MLSVHLIKQYNITLSISKTESAINTIVIFTIMFSYYNYQVHTRNLVYSRLSENIVI